MGADELNQRGRLKQNMRMREKRRGPQREKSNKMKSLEGSSSEGWLP